SAPSRRVAASRRGLHARLLAVSPHHGRGLHCSLDLMSDSHNQHVHACGRFLKALSSSVSHVGRICGSSMSSNDGSHMSSKSLAHVPFTRLSYDDGSTRLLNALTS
ncbi:hypothetical protein Dimus_037460, partial [Dionaea muscipula]